MGPLLLMANWAEKEEKRERTERSDWTITHANTFIKQDKKDKDKN